MFCHFHSWYQEVQVSTCLITSDAISDHVSKVALAMLSSTIKLLFEKDYFNAKIIVEVMIKRTKVN